LKRASCYIDGLYHAIVDLGTLHLKWLDRSLSESFLHSDEQLTAVNYFSAYATWRPDAYRRHRYYVKALEYFGVSIFMGNFKEKFRQCIKCGASWKGHEEKESDVHLSIRIVADALQDKFDRAIIISADSDIAPAIRLVKQVASSKGILVVAPPNRFGHARDLSPALAITKGRLKKHLLPQRIYDGKGNLICERPSEYDPP